MKIIRYIIFAFFVFLLSCSDEILKKDFHGKWTNCSDNSELFVSDEMILSHTNTDNKRVVLGKSTVALGEINIKNEEDFCSKVNGVYFYELYKDTLQFRLKEDMCNVRIELLDKQKFIKQ